MKKILIVNANYYNVISNNLMLGAQKSLKKTNLKISIINAPGVFEIPSVIQKYINKFNAFICLGCVIKGETPHFNFICSTTFKSIQEISIKYRKPISNGIITSLNKKQALQRSSLIKNNLKKNKGFEAAKAIISMIKNEPKKIK